MIFTAETPTLKASDVRNVPTLWDAIETVEVLDTAYLFPNVKFAQGKKRALFMPSKNKVLGFVSESYKVVQNKEVFVPIYENLVAQYGVHNITTKVRSINDVRYYVSFEVIDRPLEIVKGDLLNPTINLHNSYDSSMPFSLNLGMQRLICGNGLRAFEAHIGFQKKHTQSLEIPFDLVFDSIEAFPNYTAQFKKLTDRIMSQREILELEERVKEHSDFPKRYFSDVPLIMHREAEKLDTLPNAWLLYNGYNHILNHSPLKSLPEQKAKIDRQVLKLIEEYIS